MKRAALALIALLALTGCTEIGSISDKAQIDLALTALTTELDELAGIQTHYDAEIQPDYSYQIAVTATAPALAEQQLVAVARLVRDELGGGLFDRHRVRFELTEENGSGFSMSVFGLDDGDLAGDIAYAAAFGEAYGSPASVFFGEGNTPDTYGRVVAVALTADAPDWDAIRALPDSTRADPSWQVPGISFAGAVPAAPVTDLVDAIGRVVPLDSPDPWVFIDLYYAYAYVSLIGSDVDTADPAASSVWPIAVDVAALLDASGFSVGLSFYGQTGQGNAFVHFSDCAEQVPPSQTDTVLATALGAPAVAGQCLSA
jgi:hypothetical protein